MHKVLLVIAYLGYKQIPVVPLLQTLPIIVKFQILHFYLA